MNNAKETKPTPEEIAALAYDIWQKGGSKPGTDLENWLLAEKQLNHRAITAASQRESAKAVQKLQPEAPLPVTAQTGSTQTNHLRRATNARSQNHLARA